MREDIVFGGVIGGGMGIVGAVVSDGHAVTTAAFMVGATLAGGVLSVTAGSFVRFVAARWRYWKAVEAGHHWVYSPGLTCEWCGGPPSAEGMFAIEWTTPPGETELRPFEICPDCVLGVPPWPLEIEETE